MLMLLWLCKYYSQLTHTMYSDTSSFLIYALFSLVLITASLLHLKKKNFTYVSSNSDRCTTMAYVLRGNPSVLKHILLESLTWNSSPGLLHSYHPGISFPSEPRNSFWLYFGNLVFSESQVFLFVYPLLVEHFLRKGTWKVNFLRLFTSASLYFFTPD